MDTYGSHNGFLEWRLSSKSIMDISAQHQPGAHATHPQEPYEGNRAHSWTVADQVSHYPQGDYLPDHINAQYSSPVQRKVDQRSEEYPQTRGKGSLEANSNVPIWLHPVPHDVHIGQRATRPTPTPSLSMSRTVSDVSWNPEANNVEYTTPYSLFDGTLEHGSSNNQWAVDGLLTNRSYSFAQGAQSDTFASGLNQSLTSAATRNDNRRWQPQRNEAMGPYGMAEDHPNQPVFARFVP
ncbi:uncharacterized protein BDZ99DRAFT_255876 [Mytilinidion resinicola]|uniref:Uncharacterized protein n=1 Tax=Mytilinidion resinicola TaxID=574789 RepID=A0A6A6YWX0_9PEZI|nr:uncharacterized protein BDZ99DRAFT_255876 [Mytilinidion resinicola]KAF2813432.1 hypothetical protein BDZ99DRAFT_255876 [Mytilinidion resinicola]